MKSINAVLSGCKLNNVATTLLVCRQTVEEFAKSSGTRIILDGVDPSKIWGKKDWTGQGVRFIDDLASRLAGSCIMSHALFYMLCVSAWDEPVGDAPSRVLVIGRDHTHTVCLLSTSWTCVVNNGFHGWKLLTSCSTSSHNS